MKFKHVFIFGMIALYLSGAMAGQAVLYTCDTTDATGQSMVFNEQAPCFTNHRCQENSCPAVVFSEKAFSCCTFTQQQSPFTPKVIRLGTQYGLSTSGLCAHFSFVRTFPLAHTTVWDRSKPIPPLPLNLPLLI